MQVTGLDFGCGRNSECLQGKNRGLECCRSNGGMECCRSAGSDCDDSHCEHGIGRYTDMLTKAHRYIMQVHVRIVSIHLYSTSSRASDQHRREQS